MVFRFSHTSKSVKQRTLETRLSERGNVLVRLEFIKRSMHDVS